MRIVVKVGTRVVVGGSGIDKKRTSAIITQIAKLMRAGHRVVLVASGAVGAAMHLVSKNNPLRKKVAAAIGQPLVMESYEREARKKSLKIGQILVIHHDFTDKKRFKKFIANIEAMFKERVLPIINENDVMKTEKIRFGDNDELSALLSEGIGADKFIILTTPKGLHEKNPDLDKKAKLIKEVVKVDAKIEELCREGGTDLGMGGMLSKVRAARHATSHGIETLIGTGSDSKIIEKALGKNFPGTRFKAKKK